MITSAALSRVSYGILLLLISCVLLLKATSSANQTTSKPATAQLARLGDRISIHAAGRGNPSINLSDGRDIVAEYAGVDDASKALQDNLAEPLALASADFDEDGVPDLVSAYAGPSGGIVTLHRGNIDSIYPNSPEAQRHKASGTFTDSPLLSPAHVFELPQQGDLIAAGDFDADGHADLLVAARGSSSISLLPGDGKGSFGAARQIALPGSVTALATGEVNRADGLMDIAVGIVSPNGPQVLVFQGPVGAIKAQPEVFPLPAQATALALGSVGEDYLMDLAIAAGRELLIVHGRDRSSVSENNAQPDASLARITGRSFGFAIRSLAIGHFTDKDQPSLALLSNDGVLHLLHQPETKAKSKKSKPIDQWQDQSITMSSHAVGLVRTRVSSAQTDSLVLIDPSDRQLQIVASDPYSKNTRNAASYSPRSTASLDVEEEPVAVLPIQLNMSAFNDLMILKKGHSGPAVVTPKSMMTFVVSSATDTGLAGELRAAITNANSNPGPDMIVFQVSLGPITINLTGPLPTIIDPVTIDGTTQPLFAGSPIVELNGAGAGAGADGLGITAGNTTVRGLVINRFGNRGIAVSSGGNVIQGNFIGTNVAGTSALGNTNQGVDIADAPNNLIGGTVAAARNILSGNGAEGVRITASGATGNHVQGNLIGTDLSGTFSIANAFAGVFVTGATGNTIGGTAPGAGNLLSGGADRGIDITASGNLVQGNLIGTDVSGTTALGNALGGVLVVGANNAIGGTVAGARNVISGNFDGLQIDGGGSIKNLVQGNFIGTDVNGIADLGNSNIGVLINAAATNNTIGGTTAAARNVISGNVFGLQIAEAGTSNNIVQGNFIGTNASGTGGLGNSFQGVLILLGASNNVIGGTAAGALNVIAANGNDGVRINDAGSSNNVVQGNFIGTDVNGAALGNNRGVSIVGASNNTIGGLSSNAGNVIAFNKQNGVRVVGGTGNAILSNSIFSNSLLGIDLNDDGVTPNDPGDGDSGANNLQNFPVLTSVNNSLGGTVIQGSLNSTPNTTFTVQFFSNSSCNASGFGEGQQLIGTRTVTTDSNGDAGISFNFAGTFTPVTATATDPSGNTSEFSACGTNAAALDLAVTLSAVPNPVLPGGTLTYTITAINKGTTIADNVTVADSLPDSVAFVSCSSNGGGICLGSGNDRRVGFGALLPGTSATITLVTRVNGSIANGTVISDTATITSAANDANPADNVAMTSTSVSTSALALNCPPSIIQNIDAGKCTAVVAYPLPVVNIPGLNLIVSCSPPSGSIFPVSFNEVNCSARDATGVRATCSFLIRVDAPLSVVVSLEGGGSTLDLGPAAAQRKTKKPPKGCACDRTFTVENTGCGSFTLGPPSILRTGSDVISGRIANPDDSKLFSLRLILSDGSELPVPCSAMCFLNIGPGETLTFRVLFKPGLPAFAGKTNGLSSVDVLPDTITTNITFKLGTSPPSESTLVINLVAHVSTDVQIINPDDARAPKRAAFTKSGNEFTVAFGVFDSDLDVNRARFEFLDSSGQVLGQAFDVDITQPISQGSIVKGQSFDIVQKFTGAKDHPEVAGVRVTVSDPQSSDSVTAQLGSSASSVSLIQSLQKRAPLVVLPVSEFQLRP